MQPRRNHDTDKAESLNPVLLTLALWLGLVVSVTGMTRYLQSAAESAANAQAAASRSPAQPAVQDNALTILRFTMGG